MEQPPEQPKTKKQRTPAQQEATAKMLQSLAEKRRADWEQKKTKILAEHGSKIKEMVEEPKEPEPAPEPVPVEKPKPKPRAKPQPKPEPSVNIEELKAQIREELKREQAPPKDKKPKKRVVVEESSDSEEEVVIVKKKTRANQPPDVSKPKQANPYDVLENLFFRTR